MNARCRLDGQVAVVTGAGGKLGPIWIGGLLEAGAVVVGLDLDGAPHPPALSGLVDQYGDRRLALMPADVTDRSTLVAARTRCLDRFGVPSVLVNNAGIDQPPSAAGRSYRIEDVPADISRQIFEVNTLGTFQAAQVFGVEMANAQRGSIINIGSLYASVSPDARFYDHLERDPPFLKPPAYGASKAAVVSLTRYLATVWGRFGVRVNALSPGGVAANQDAEFTRKFCARVPLGRMAQHDDLVGPLQFLASDASAYVTGADLPIDGGFTAW